MRKNTGSMEQKALGEVFKRENKHYCAQDKLVK